MDRVLRSWLSAIAILGWVYSSSTPLYARDDAQIEFEEIARRLEAWRSSFVNLRVVWEMRSLPTTTKAPLPQWSPPEHPAEHRLFHAGEWIWADHGLHLLESRGIFRDGSSVRSMDVFNGPRSLVFRASYRQQPEEPEIFVQLTLRGVTTGKPTSFFGITPVQGIYWPGSAAWLSEMLSQWEWRLEGIEELAGARCARIAAVQPEVVDVEWLEILWLDLEHDCLVRRHLSPSIPDRRRGGDFIVDEFQRLEEGIWFPKRGRVQLHTSPYENQFWEVTGVSLNERLDMMRFEPPAPADGTIVDDHERLYTHGVPRGPNPPGLQADAASHAPMRSSSAVSATPPTSGWIWWSGALLALSAMFLAAGFWLRHKQ